MPKPLDSAVVLLTGASSGIGLAVAQLLLGSTYRLVLTTRASSLSKLEKNGIQQSARVLIRPLDVTIEDEQRAVVEEVTKTWGGVDVLVNNAGISFRSVMEHMNEECETLQWRTNYLGPMNLTRLVLPHMRAQQWGRIINVSSVGGMMAMPTMGSYSASKFALEGASEALWYELRPWNVSVTLVQPGFINSPSFRRVLWSPKSVEAARGHSEYSAYYQHMSGFIERLMARAFATPESLARTIEKTIRAANPPLRMPATIDACFFSMLRRYLPRRLYHWMLYRGLPGVDEWRKS